MNKYDERYEIRLANVSEINQIMNFIEEHWKKGHILSVDRKLFEYEFVDNETVHIIIAIDKETRAIEALAGFLKCSHTSDPEKLDVWGSLWKVNDSHQNMTFLGVELIRRLTDILHCRNHLGIGINPKTTMIIRKTVFHETVSKMKHYYRLNPDILEYKIAVVNHRNILSHVNSLLETKAVEFFSVEAIRQRFDIEKLNCIPYKDFWYLEKRFFRHPYYVYRVLGLERINGEIEALMVMRIVKKFDHKVLRIVDYIGNQTLFGGLGNLFSKLLCEMQLEYVDFYTLGFDEQSILNAGFQLKDNSDVNIIPNYFEPFVQENVDIWVRYKTDKVLFCKADGDQDRPNTFTGV